LSVFSFLGRAQASVQKFVHLNADIYRFFQTPNF